MNSTNFQDLVKTISALRDPDSGCPWDLEQDHQSLSPYLIEETYELLETLQSRNYKEMKEELGDVLLQILLHSELASEKNEFDIFDVCQSLNEKMIRRHPHVFQKQKTVSIEDLKENWEKTKKSEGKIETKYIKKKDLHLPSLASAHKIGERTNKVKFDWENSEETFKQFEAEIIELKNTLGCPSKSKFSQFENTIEEELGDVLFTLAQLSRHLGFNAELTLKKANLKFYQRFQEMIELSDKDFSELDQSEKEELWKKVKENEK